MRAREEMGIVVLKSCGEGKILWRASLRGKETESGL